MHFAGLQKDPSSLAVNLSRESISYRSMHKQTPPPPPPCTDAAGTETSHPSLQQISFRTQIPNEGSEFENSFSNTAPARASALQHNLGQPNKGSYRHLKENQSVL